VPKALEAKLKREYGAKSKVPYKIVNKMGVMRGNKITAKGRAMEAKPTKQSDGITARVSNFNFRRPKRKVQVRNYK
jgi:ssDNA-binding replication factor A large subunit